MVIIMRSNILRAFLRLKQRFSVTRKSKNAKGKKVSFIQWVKETKVFFSSHLNYYDIIIICTILCSAWHFGDNGVALCGERNEVQLYECHKC